MIDREKVINGLKCIVEGTVRCESCGYSIDKHGHYSCQQNCASDAIAMLKESESIVRCRDCKHLHPEKLYMCRIHGSAFQPKDRDWFCADGEREVSK